MATGAAAYEFTVELPSLGAAPAPAPLHRTRHRTLEIPEASVPVLGRLEAAERFGEPRVLLDVETSSGSGEIELPLRVRALPDGRTEISGRAYRLWVSLLVDQELEGKIEWRLDPGGNDSAARARIIDFLIALSGQGLLVVSDPDAGAIASFRLPGTPPDPDLSAERAFLTEVLVVEAWSGMWLPVPDEPTETDLSVLGELRAWVQRPTATARFVGPVTGVVSEVPVAADRLQLFQPWWPLLFGLGVRMGTFSYDVPATYDGADLLADGSFRARFLPRGEGRVPAELVPPGNGKHRREAVAKIEAGQIPEPEPQQETPRTRKLRERAQALAREWDLESEEDQKARDEIRRRWPT